MKRQINNKRREQHDTIRKTQIEDYKRIVRATMLNEWPNSMEHQDINAQTILFINNKDLAGLYDSLYKQNCLPKLQKLDKVILLQLFLFLTKNLDKTQGILLVTSLIDCQYPSIFLSETNNNLCKQLIEKLYHTLDLKIGEYVNNKQESTQKLINVYLNCVKSLIYNKMQKNSNDYGFLYVLDYSFVKSYIFPWLTHLYSNAFYLILLYFAQIQYALSAEPQFKAFIQQNSHLVHALIDQIQIKSQKKQPIAIPSLLLVNSYIRQVSTEKMLSSLLTNYLQKFKFVYGMVQQKKGKSHYKLSQMYMMVDTLHVLFENLSQFQSKRGDMHLGSVLNKAGIWNFFSLLLRVQTTYLREQIYFLIKMSLENMLTNKVVLEQFLKENILYFFIEGLEQSQCPEIILYSLQMIQYLIQYDMQSSSSLHVFSKTLNEYQLKFVLQNLEHFKKNQDIKVQARRILALKQSYDQIYSNEIDVEL